MFKQLALAAAVPLALGGCLPIPFTIASTALSGVSYLTTGKSSTDHVISATLEEDCALTNPLFGEDVCGVLDPNDNTYASVAVYPGDRDDGGPSARALTPSLEAPRTTVAGLSGDVLGHQDKIAGLTSFSSAVPEITVAGLSLRADQLAEVSGRAVAVQTVNSAASTTWASATPTTKIPTPKVPSRGIEVAPLPAPSGFTASTANKPGQASGTLEVDAKAVKVPLANTPPAARRAAVESSTTVQAAPAQATAPVSADVSSQDGRATKNAAPRLPTVETGSMGDTGRYIVVGSFRERDRADRLAATLTEHAPVVLAATVKGERWNRVAIGPLQPGEVAGIRSVLGRVAGRDPWVVLLENPIILASN